jgi:hypothetical protein
MNATDLSQLTIKELRSIALENDIEIIGDKRSKSSYISALESFQSEQTVIEIETLPTIPDSFESIDLPLTEAAVMADRSTNPLDLYLESDGSSSTPLPTDLSPVPTNQHRGAAVVVLIPLILLSVAVIAIRIGISALIPTIAAVGRLSVAVWRSIPRTIDTNSIPIDYFPA